MFYVQAEIEFVQPQRCACVGGTVVVQMILGVANRAQSAPAAGLVHCKYTRLRAQLRCIAVNEFALHRLQCRKGNQYQ
ncbi:hypothetical protein D3C77_734640 [compost metagenome]